jgi:hypothetical protein
MKSQAKVGYSIVSASSRAKAGEASAGRAGRYPLAATPCTSGKNRYIGFVQLLDIS